MHTLLSGAKINVAGFLITKRCKASLRRIRPAHERSLLPHFGCRDYLTVEALRRNGIHNELITGCPVWYHFWYAFPGGRSWVSR